jgi:hypothetical protein
LLTYHCLGLQTLPQLNVNGCQQNGIDRKTSESGNRIILHQIKN